MLKKALLTVAAAAFVTAGATAVHTDPAQALWMGKDKGAHAAKWNDYWAKKKAWWKSQWLGWDKKK